MSRSKRLQATSPTGWVLKKLERIPGTRIERDAAPKTEDRFEKRSLQQTVRGKRGHIRRLPRTIMVGGASTSCRKVQKKNGWEKKEKKGKTTKKNKRGKTSKNIEYHKR